MSNKTDVRRVTCSFVVGFGGLFFAGTAFVNGTNTRMTWVLVALCSLIAFYFEGRSLQEMSDSFDSPVGTIKRRLHTARHRLREELSVLNPA